MNKLKVMVVVGTRPEIIRLSEVIKAIDKYFELVANKDEIIKKLYLKH